jgi:hypothetical protein
VNVALLPFSTPCWEVVERKDPSGLIATCEIVRWSSVEPEGVQDNEVLGSETFRMLLPPGATVNWMPDWRSWPFAPEYEPGTTTVFFWSGSR